jgi:hypothetical protein
VRRRAGASTGAHFRRPFRFLLVGIPHLRADSSNLAGAARLLSLRALAAAVARRNHSQRCSAHRLEVRAHSSPPGRLGSVAQGNAARQRC